MSNAFRILNDLLRAVPSEASGRASAPLTDDLKEKLVKLAHNQLDDESCENLFAEICQNEKALSFLAEQLRLTAPNPSK